MAKAGGGILCEMQPKVSRKMSRRQMKARSALLFWWANCGSRALSSATATESCRSDMLDMLAGLSCNSRPGYMQSKGVVVRQWEKVCCDVALTQPVR